MARRPKKPRSLEEVTERIKKARASLGGSYWLGAQFAFDQIVAHRAPGFGLPAGTAREIHERRQRHRRRLSRRVRRWYRRTGQVSLVCSLIRHSPIFLRDKWINDLILDLKKTACCDGSLARREEALRDLCCVSEAIRSENLPTRRGGERRPWRYVSARRPSWAHTAALELLKDYNGYLEIGTCILATPLLCAAEWARGERLRGDPRTQEHYAEKLGVPAEWIGLAWDTKGLTPHEWARLRLADECSSTPDGIRRRLADARRCDKRALDHLATLGPVLQRRSDERAKTSRGNGARHSSCARGRPRRGVKRGHGR